MVDTTSLEQPLESIIQSDQSHDGQGHNRSTHHEGENGTIPTARQIPTADDLLQRCSVLIAELEEFKTHLKESKQDQIVEIAHFRNTVKSEHRTLERLAQKGVDSAEATQHTVNSSNLPFLETVWAVVKSTRGLQALQKRFYWHGGDVLNNGRIARKIGEQRAIRGVDKKKQSALVDVVGKDGMEWVKVSLITNTRLLFDKAKQGWEEVSSTDEGSDEEDASNGKKEDKDNSENDIPLIRMAKDLFRAARAVRIRTQHPAIRLVLPKIQEGEIDEIDDILQSLRQMGCTVETADTLSTTTDNIRSPPPLSKVIDSLLTDPSASLTQTINIDCTILLALVSDFSHCTVEAEPWFHRALKRQVEIEDKENLLPNLLYPAIAGHRLVCTKEAAKRMREIVDTIGTPGERARTTIFMGNGGYETGLTPDTENIHSKDDTEQSLRDELQTWSKFEVPSTLHLPISVVDSGIRLTNKDLTTEQVVNGTSHNGTFNPDPKTEPTIVYPDSSSSSFCTPGTNTPDTNGKDNTDDPDPTLHLLPPSARKLKPHLTYINQSVFLHGWLEGITTITSNRTVVKQIDTLLDRYARDDTEWPLIWLCPTARSLVGKEKGRN